MSKKVPSRPEPKDWNQVAVLIEALRSDFKTVAEGLGMRIESVERRMDGLEGRMNTLEGGMDGLHAQMRQGFEMVFAEFGKVHGRLNQLDQRLGAVESRN